MILARRKNLTEPARRASPMVEVSDQKCRTFGPSKILECRKNISEPARRASPMVEVSDQKCRTSGPSKILGRRKNISEPARRASPVVEVYDRKCRTSRPLKILECPKNPSEPARRASPVVEVSDRKCRTSSPLKILECPKNPSEPARRASPMVEVPLPQHEPPQLSHIYRQLLPETEHTNAQSAGRFGTATRPILSIKLARKPFLRWVFIVLNVVFEVCQAALAQEVSHLRRQFYLELSMITSSVCLMVSLVEAVHEGRIRGVVWQKRGHCCWFYYPGTHGPLFGRFSLYFGIICSMIQLLFNLIEKFTRKDFIKFDFVPLLLSVCYLVAAMIASHKQDNSLAVVKCKIHGYKEAWATSMDGHMLPVFECPECRLSNAC